MTENGKGVRQERRARSERLNDGKSEGDTR